MHILLHDVPLHPIMSLFCPEPPPPSYIAPPVQHFEILFVKVLRSVFQSWRSRQKREGKFRILFYFLHFNFVIILKCIRLGISLILTAAQVPSVARRI